MLIRVGRKKGEKELGDLAYGNELRLFGFEAFEVFLKITAACCITSEREAGNTERWLLELGDIGEYQQYLEQKFTFSLTVPSSSYTVLNWPCLSLT